jgi:RHS repeat-associated protein
LKRNGDFDSNIYGFMEIDDLVYDYDDNLKNQLVNVTDNTNDPKGFKDENNGTADYDYDANGNMIKDENKNISSIVYNHLNLPTQINFATGDKIEYLYDAIGQKKSKKVTQADTETLTDYLDGYQYTNEVLNFFPHAEGYVNMSYCRRCDEQGSKFEFNYVYNYTDHLGNIRVSYSVDKIDRVIKILEENHYYPFGLKHTNYNSGNKKYYEEDIVLPLGMVATAEPAVLEAFGKKIIQTLPSDGVMYKYKYNGKEYQDELGLNMYDYGARNYDPALGRWMNVDPLAEQYRRWSPYNYVMNNPLSFVDPDGMSVDGWIKQVADGATTMTYNPAVNTMEEAAAAGYENVESVGATGSVAAKDGSYSLALNADGSVTDQNNGQAVNFGQPSSSGFGGEITTSGGTTVQSPSIMYNEPLKASGAITEDNTIANIFIGNAVLKPLFGGASASATGRVFWSGGKLAKGEAASFAAANGMKTLEMTPAGSIMNTVSPFLPKSITTPIWNNLSSNFAKGAAGEANFFTTVAGPKATSIWSTVEQPILQSNGVKIITNIVK